MLDTTVRYHTCLEQKCCQGVNMYHVGLFVSLKEFLPKEYIKQRGAEKRIFQVCAALHNTKTINTIQNKIQYSFV